jgi:hypothetical protein
MANQVVKGGARGYFTDVSLFGGPSSVRGFGQKVPPGNKKSASPSVALPAGGSTAAITKVDTDGALAQYGPAVLFGGKPPASPDAPLPPSGEIRVTTQGKRTVTSTASVKEVGPGPLTADSVRSTCHASKSGVTASTTITRGVLATATDADGNTTTTEAIPSRPPANYTLTGTTGTGDNFRAVFNEQTVNEDGSITVDAVHLYLLGPTAVGEVVVAQSYAGAS